MKDNGSSLKFFARGTNEYCMQYSKEGLLQKVRNLTKGVGIPLNADTVKKFLRGKGGFVQVEV